MIDDIEVVVYLPSQDLAENMPKNNVRASYSVGDQVKIVDGQHSGLLGWVVAVSSSMLRIVNIEGQIEVNVSVTEVAFSSATHIVGLQPRGEYSKWGKLGERNPNDVYIGKRVMIIGSHQLKGYKGGIKTTTPEGDAFVELDACLQ
ncbi:hypothetical protein BDN70DRAFT_815019 [Pholiota conissans]|uniref:KOW domain-containing protein n=1 Tax=Pholiota conissans TaxID=109636 RepID=A0A9P6CPM2_9AGAR|nr:hypothetical protein BDN70DRAFT_815019 [Pholiota conissans]